MDDNEPRCRLTKCLDVVEIAIGLYALGLFAWMIIDLFIVAGGWFTLKTTIVGLILAFLVWLALDLTIGFVRFVDEILRGSR